jgi:serine/threonine protein kinase
LYNFPNPEISQFNLSNLEGISVIAQLSNTLKWLHDNKILHNDIKLDNVTKDNVQFHAILIDFGKACSFANAKRKELSEELKVEYREKHAHIASEIIEGKSKQSLASDADVYALERVVLN